MRRLVVRSLLFILLIVGSNSLIVLFAFQPDSPKYSYLSASVAKHHRLDSIPSPRLIFVGGSNLAFGLDSPRLEQELGVPVVNMALHADLGLRYMLNEVQASLGQGDIVVISPEYEQFFGTLDGGPTLLDALFVFPQGLGYVTSEGQRTVLLEGLLVSLQDMVKARLDALIFHQQLLKSPVYNAKAFNAEGDVIAHLNLPSEDISGKRMGLQAPIDRQAIEALNRFADVTKQKGALALFLFPPIPEIQYRQAQAGMQAVCAALQNDTTIRILGTPGDYVFPESYFFDTVYHLNARGREARTDKVIAALRRASTASRSESACDTETR